MAPTLADQCHVAWRQTATNRHLDQGRQGTVARTVSHRQPQFGGFARLAQQVSCHVYLVAQAVSLGPLFQQGAHRPRPMFLDQGSQSCQVAEEEPQVTVSKRNHPELLVRTNNQYDIIMYLRPNIQVFDDKTGLTHTKIQIHY